MNRRNVTESKGVRNMMITMSKNDYEIILKHARENLPEEACGLIAGKKDGNNKSIEKVY